MRLRVYLDTSVFSALLDDRLPDRRRLTAEFWARRTEFDAASSELARDELSQTPGGDHRQKLLSSLGEVHVFPIGPDMHELAARLVDAEAFSAAMYNDALHVAAAVLSGQHVLVSWNFKHLVNRRRRAQVN